ncbi:MAG: hypothetical protein J5831_01975 [Bacteroidales bacterium]|nr:hypothetical protein [Bacteroidales bacterium]
MKKGFKRIWIRILSGLALTLGVSSCFGIHSPKLYGPPPATLYGPPPTEMETDTTPDIINEAE